MCRPFGGQSLSSYALLEWGEPGSTGSWLWKIRLYFNVMSAWYIMVFLFLVRDLLQHARSQIHTTEGHTNSCVPPKAQPSKASYPTSVGYEVNWNFLVVYHLWLLVVTAQVVQRAADFQDHSCKYELSRIGIVLDENNDERETQAGFLFWCLKFRSRGSELHNKEKIHFRLFWWLTSKQPQLVQV